MGGDIEVFFGGVKFGRKSPESRVQSPESRVQSPGSRVQSPGSSPAFRICPIGNDRVLTATLHSVRMLL